MTDLHAPYQQARDFLSELAQIRATPPEPFRNDSYQPPAAPASFNPFSEAMKNPGATQTSPNTVHIPAFSYDASKYPPGDWRSTITPDEAFIIQHESGFNPNSYNKTPVFDQGREQHAFGLGQLIDENRQSIGHRLGINPDTTNPFEQLALFRAYAQQHYGSMASARAHYKVGVGY